MEKLYPSDITRKQFEIIEPLLSGANKQTRPREIDLYYVFCAILYILKSGCQWRIYLKNIQSGVVFIIILVYGGKVTMIGQACLNKP